MSTREWTERVQDILDAIGEIHAYDRMLVRRAQAALILKQRGYDLTDLAVSQTP